LLKSDNMT